MKIIITFIKKEIVLCAAILLAIISSFFVLPDKNYIQYIDFRTLSILFSLMGVMAGFQKIGVFEFIAQSLLLKTKNYFQLILILILLCFFFSMIITNDVALITFVPFTFIVFSMIPKNESDFLIIPVIVLQTIAANLGSMIFPIGNPQNLYLYELSKMNFSSFILIMLPFTIFSLILLCVFSLIINKLFKRNFSKISTFQNELKISLKNNISFEKTKFQLIIYIFLFIACILTVTHILSYKIMVFIVIFVLFFTDKKILTKIDYSLLFTFIGFFIFVGNINRIPQISDFLLRIINENEIFVSVILSQMISNVPAALLLSGFTQKFNLLIIGTNIGGLGTLIASMASLISFKLFSKSNSNQKGKYIFTFTIYNLIFLIFMIIEILIIL